MPLAGPSPTAAKPNMAYTVNTNVNAAVKHAQNKLDWGKSDGIKLNVQPMQPTTGHQEYNESRPDKNWTNKISNKLPGNQPLMMTKKDKGEMDAF
ncbi:MAG: hypothetical protein EAY75_04070 [Bacteroidetes bacterium]|nr:MAG: hypothetical protein EAY75_04070 [Bacteroidota bacterium]